jgi:hypothetical protein
MMEKKEEKRYTRISEILLYYKAIRTTAEREKKET